MSDEAATLNAVLESPHDDAPRLAYADVLAATGIPANVARAELIRTQIQIEHIRDNDRDWPKLAGRERDLMAEWGATWERPLRQLLQPSFLRPGKWLKAQLFGKGGSWKFHRGFVEEIDSTAAGFMQEDSQLFGHTPIRRVVLSHATSHIESLAIDPRLEKLYSLHLIADVEFDEEMEQLRQQAESLGLTVLELRFPRIQSDAGDLLSMLRNAEDDDLERVAEKLDDFRNWARASERERERLREIARRPRLVQRLTEQEHFSHAELLRLNDWIYLGDRLRQAGAWAVVKSYHDLEDEEGHCRRLVLFKKNQIVKESFEALGDSPHVYREAAVG